MVEFTDMKLVDKEEPTGMEESACSEEPVYTEDYSKLNGDSPLHGWWVYLDPSPPPVVQGSAV